jgi:hypothetical protein
VATSPWQDNTSSSKQATARRVNYYLTGALVRVGYRCQTCGENDVRLEVHHNTYERYGDESIFDLVVL